jgi:hypothetical protein
MGLMKDSKERAPVQLVQGTRGSEFGKPYVVPTIVCLIPGIDVHQSRRSCIYLWSFQSNLRFQLPL